MSKQTTDREIISHGLELLRAGILASGLPNRLMDEYSLTPERARELAGKAIERQSPSRPPRGKRQGKGP